MHTTGQRWRGRAAGVAAGFALATHDHPSSITPVADPGTSSVIIDVGVAPVAAGATLERHDQGVRGFVIDALTPESETSSHYFWGMARNFDIDDPGFTARFKRQQGGVFAEDLVILEAQQRSMLVNPELKLKAFGIDSGGVHRHQSAVAASACRRDLSV